MVTLEPMPWDTKHFGIAVGRLNPSGSYSPEALKLALFRSGFTVVIARLAVENMTESSSLEAAGFAIRDVRVHLSLMRGEFHPSETVEGVSIVGYERRHKESLRRISSRSFWSDHYHADPEFDRDKVDQMYSLWIDKGVRERYVIRVAILRGRVVGFLAGKAVADGFYIELVAVDEAFRRKGIASALLADLLSSMKDDQRTASIGVQLANISALRLYEKMGFRAQSAEFTFHWWRQGQKAKESASKGSR